MLIDEKTLAEVEQMKRRKGGSFTVTLHDPRPDDMAELARMTAAELRKRGIWAERAGFAESVVEVWGVSIRDQHAAECDYYQLYAPDFDNLGPIACADVIQAEEAKRAQEWAGDP